MIPDRKQRAVRQWGPVAASALAVVSIAAATEPDRSWARIRAMSLEQRSKLMQNLRRFDLELTPEKQRALRDLDRRITELEPARQAEYLAVLRRYHNWLSHLPENRRDELLNLPAAERMALIRKLLAEHPVPKADTPQVLRIAELGEYSPFELASVFQIWRKASAAQRERVERTPAPRRREALFRLGADLEIPRETRPAKFDEEKWIAAIEGNWRKARPLLFVDEVIKKKLETVRDEAVKRKLESRRRDLLHRQAINLYLTHQEVRSVDPDRLAQFVALLPAWVRSTLDPYPPDEARRRVSFAYRLVFPHPAELKAGRPAAAAPAPAKARPVVAPKGAGPGPGKGKAESTTDAPF
jgi:hypothetical protein